MFTSSFMVLCCTDMIVMASYSLCACYLTSVWSRKLTKQINWCTFVYDIQITFCICCCCKLVQTANTYCWWARENVPSGQCHLVTFWGGLPCHVWPAAVRSCLQSTFLPYSSAVLWWRSSVPWTASSLECTGFINFYLIYIV